MRGEVGTRDVRLPDDGDFLLAVYASTREPEVRLMGLSPVEADGFIRMQFEARARHYDGLHPHAVHSIISVGGEPAGRLTVDRSGDEIRIVDIALLPAFRRAGVGGTLVRRLFDEADASALPVRCHVVQGNDARLFWEHLGLLERGVDGAHVAMERACETSQR
jgi:GNAT superfamily N-acetyltransferase